MTRSEDVVWQGAVPEGDGESPDAEVRVRRLDEHTLIVERRLRGRPPGSPAWEATDDDVAARAYEQALLHLLAERGEREHGGPGGDPWSEYYLVRPTLKVLPPGPPAGHPDAVGAVPPGVREGMANLTEREFTASLISLVNGASGLPREDLCDIMDVGLDDTDSLLGMEAASFKDGGIMSSNEGLTVRLPNGRTFQVTVVRSR